MVSTARKVSHLESFKEKSSNVVFEVIGSHGMPKNECIVVPPATSAAIPVGATNTNCFFTFC